MEGFQIRGGEAGVRIRDSNVILIRDDIAEAHGAGVEVSGDSHGAIVACDIHGNAGPGIVLPDGAAPSIENNLIRENGVQANSLQPGVLMRSAVHPVIVGNIIAGNGAEAFWMPQPDETILQRNAFQLGSKVDNRPKFRIIPLQEGRP
jgi:hypothetical protein